MFAFTPKENDEKNTKVPLYDDAKSDDETVESEVIDVKIRL